MGGLHNIHLLGALLVEVYLLLGMHRYKTTCVRNLLCRSKYLKLMKALMRLRHTDIRDNFGV